MKRITLFFTGKRTGRKYNLMFVHGNKKSALRQARVIYPAKYYKLTEITVIDEN